MSKTAFYAGMIKQELERLASRSPHDEQKFGYILHRLWPDLESAISQELGDTEEGSPEKQ